MTAPASSALPEWCTLVRADNPSPMTLDGTNTYLLRGPSSSSAVVVDPGPLLESHLEAVAAHGPVALVLLTHGHPDHAEGAARFAAMTGAEVLARDLSWCTGSDRLPADGEVVEVGGVRITVLDTPGHSADSVCFLVPDPTQPAVLTGDTILGRGTTVVAHPDGRLGDYLRSLDRLRELGPLSLLPGHGPPGAPTATVARDYLAHRAERLAQVEAALVAGDRTAEEVVRRVYADVDPALWPAATLSVRAQLDYLAERGATPLDT